jgi:hypothetical protein
MYPEVLPQSLWELLEKLHPVLQEGEFYLAGGSALAIQLGHRISEDLDFFSAKDFNSEQFRFLFQKTGLKGLAVNDTGLHTEMIIQSIRVYFIKQIIPLTFPLIAMKQLDITFFLADAKDIGRMKLMAIGSRGNRKDFVDLYCLTRQTISLDTLLHMAMEESKGVSYSKTLFLKGLLDFKGADEEEPINMTWDADWDEIKHVLTNEVKEIAKHI